jgi:hypothetical protein
MHGHRKRMQCRQIKQKVLVQELVPILLRALQAQHGVP